jgi:hypothetical protein
MVGVRNGVPLNNTVERIESLRASSIDARGRTWGLSGRSALVRTGVIQAAWSMTASHRGCVKMPVEL